MRVPAAAYWKEKIVREFGSVKAKGKEKMKKKGGRDGGAGVSARGAEAFLKGYHPEKEEEERRQEEEKEKEMDGKLEIEK